MTVKLPLGVWLMAAAKVAVHLATTRLSFHRDELYFVAASKRLAASYVDFQPLVPLLVRWERAVFGDALLGLRLIPALAGALVIVLAALIARELGGGRRAQLLAAFALLVVPLFIGMDTILATVTLETPAWMLVALVAARLARTDDARWWVPLGAAVALALLVKFTVLAFLAGLAVAVLTTPLRRHLRTPWPWVGALVVAAALAPSVVWQARHSWAVIEFVSNQGTGGRILGLGGRPGFLASLVVLPGPVALWLWVPGLRRRWRDERFRVLGIAHAVALVVLLAASGKGYYAAPGIAVLLAAGAVALDARPGWSPRRLVVGLVVSALLVAPITLPVLPTSALRVSEDLSDATELGERLGWEDLAATVSDVVRALPPEERERATVLGDNYAVAAAVEFYADAYGLPPSGSGHNSAYLWPPPARDDRVVIAIGFGSKRGRRYTRLGELYRDVRRVGTVTNRDRVPNYEFGKPIWVARGPRLPWVEEWERLKLFTA